MQELLNGSGLSGLYSQLMDSDVSYMSVDCTSLTAAKIREDICGMQFFSGIRVVFLDEAHRFDRAEFSDLLLKEIEQKNFIWIASAVACKAADTFWNRFSIKVSTSPPRHRDMAIWLAGRCKAWNIAVDAPQTLISLARRSGLNPGKALNLLAYASICDPAELTGDLVETYDFNS